MIARADIESAQTAWGQAVIAVGAASSWEQAHGRAVKLVESLYLVEDGSLLFCPTKVTDSQFRTTAPDAVSYFVGGDPSHPEDRGFALEPWVAIRFDNAGVVCREDVGIAMGNYFFAREDGSEFKVEYSFVYLRDPGGGIKIQLHHSALPYKR